MKRKLKNKLTNVAFSLFFSLLLYTNKYKDGGGVQKWALYLLPSKDYLLS